MGTSNCSWSVPIQNKAMRELDRERAKMEQQEKKIIADIKKMAKQGQMDAVKVMAKVNKAKKFLIKSKDLLIVNEDPHPLHFILGFPKINSTYKSLIIHPSLGCIKKFHPCVLCYTPTTLSVCKSLKATPSGAPMLKYLL